MKPVIRQAFFCTLTLLIAISCDRKKESPSELSSPSEPNDSNSAVEAAPALMQRALDERKMHRWTEAVDDCQKAIALDPNDPDVHRGAKIFVRLTPLLAAIRELDARLAMTPEDDQLLTDRALLFLRADDGEMALMDSEAAAQKAEWAVRPRLFHALALISLNRAAECGKLGVEQPLRLTSLSAEFLETIGRLDAEISLERDNADLYVARAWQLNEIGQPRLALQDAERATTLDTNSAGAFLEYGYALAKLGHADEALAQIKRATELDPQLAPAQQYLAELQRIK